MADVSEFSFLAFEQVSVTLEALAEDA